MWDTKTGDLRSTLSGHQGPINDAAFSADGARIVTASDDNTARVWDVETGVTVAKLSGHVDRVVSARFSPDGSSIVTASFDRTAKIWDVRTGVAFANLTGHTDWLNSAAFSADGARIVTASFDHTAMLWDARTGTRLVTLSGHADRTQRCVFSPDGARVVTASADKTARIWDARTAPCLPDSWDTVIGVNSASYTRMALELLPLIRQHCSVGRDDRHNIDHSLGARGSGSQCIFQCGRHSRRDSICRQTARVWDATTGAALIVLAGHTGG